MNKSGLSFPQTSTFCNISEKSQSHFNNSFMVLSYQINYVSSPQALYTSTEFIYPHFTVAFPRIQNYDSQQICLSHWLFKR